MTPITISTRALIDANKAALADGTLGALKHHGGKDGALYDFGDGCRCALGVALGPSVREVIKLVGLNASGVDDLVYSKFVVFEHYYIAYWLQTLHDSWLAEMRAPGSSFGAPDALRPFLDSRCCNRMIDEKTFRDFIALLDATFPAEAN